MHIHNLAWQRTVPTTNILSINVQEKKNCFRLPRDGKKRPRFFLRSCTTRISEYARVGNIARAMNFLTVDVKPPVKRPSESVPPISGILSSLLCRCLCLPTAIAQLVIARGASRQRYDIISTRRRESSAFGFLSCLAATTPRLQFQAYIFKARFPVLCVEQRKDHGGRSIRVSAYGRLGMYSGLARKVLRRASRSDGF